VIYYQPDNYDHTWIGNLSSQTWAYYPGIGFSSDYWQALPTKTTSYQTLYFDFLCLDSDMYNEDSNSNDHILGIPRVAFIIILVVVLVVAMILVGIAIWYSRKNYKNKSKPIIIQSSSHGLMKKILSKSQSVFSSTRSEEIAATVVVALEARKGRKEEESSSEINKQASSEETTGESGNSQNLQNESSEKPKLDQRPLTEAEIAAVKHGGIYLKGYRESAQNIEEEEESLSSVDLKKVQFKDHKVFQRADQNNENVKAEEWLNPITGEMELKQVVQQRLAAASSQKS